MHVALFDAIHKDGNPLNSEAQIAALFKKDAGIEADKFSGTFNGFVVDAQVRKAEALSRSYGIYSVPTIVVGGKYATGPAMTRSEEHTSELQSLMRISYAVFCLKKKTYITQQN